MRAFLTSEGSVCVFGGKSSNLYGSGKEKEPEPPPKKMQEQGTQESVVWRNSCLPCSCQAQLKLFLPTSQLGGICSMGNLPSAPLKMPRVRFLLIHKNTLTLHTEQLGQKSSETKGSA